MELRKLKADREKDKGNEVFTTSFHHRHYDQPPFFVVVDALKIEEFDQHW